MELQFNCRECSCLEIPMRESRNQEQTLEIKLPDGMPDIGRILGSWGQSLLRGKEWLGNRISASCGMFVWVLYAPEDGTQCRCVEGWIPFQAHWDIPDNTPEGKLRIGCMTRFLDARSVSARKIMIRAGMSVLAEVLSPMKLQICQPEENGEDIQLLRNTYPVRLIREAGEKAFRLDEDLTMPPAMPQPEKLLYGILRPQGTECKVMGSKAVFRGNGNLHLLYLSEEGQLHTWDFALPYSQFAELEAAYSPDATVEVLPGITDLELHLDEEGHIRLKCGMVGQYLVDDLQMVELVEDAYKPGQDLTVHQEQLRLPAVLEKRQENIFGEQSIPVDADAVPDIQLWMEYPLRRESADGVDILIPGTIQVLYYDENGSLQSSMTRWEGQLRLAAGDQSKILALPLNVALESRPEKGSLKINTELPLAITAVGCGGLPMVTGVELGEQRKPDPNRPSLILCRAGEQGLWEIAKESGSTMESIRRLNGLQKEPAPGQMLLIPVM